MEDQIFYLAAANYIIGGCFLVVTLSTLWLYHHRHGDWPKSWALLLGAVCMGACGVPRLVHGIMFGNWPNVSLHVLVLADIMSAFTSAVGALLIPWAVWVIRQFPSPAEVRHAINGNEQKKLWGRIAKFEKTQKELSENRAKRLESILLASNLDDSLKEQILEATKVIPLEGWTADKEGEGDEHH